ncbi:hypothetical protein ACPCG0_06365 [Propionibacteriaceae bacterium Y1923]
MQHGETGPDDATVYRPQAAGPQGGPGPDEGTVYRPQTPPSGASPHGAPPANDATVYRPQTPPSGASPHGAPPAHDATVLRPRPAAPAPVPDDGDGEATHLVGRPPASGTTPPASWVNDANWAKQTGTPSSIPPISASEVPTFPQFDSQQFPQDYSAYSLPEDRFQAPPEVRQRTRPKLPITRVLGWTFAVVLLAVAAGVGYVSFFRTPVEDEAVKVPVTQTASVQVVRGDEVVRQYLQALAAGDVDAARSLGPLGGAGSTALMTREAYAEALKAAPITEVNVPTTDENATDIPATYKLGDQEVSTRFRVRKLDSGSWEMAQTTVTFRMQGTSVTNVPLIVNGVRLDWDTPLELFPGAYQVTTGLPFISFAATDSLTVLHLGYSDTTSHPVTPLLTEAGTAAFKKAVTTSLTQCTSRKELAPANCPMNYGSSKPVVPGTVTWTLNGDPVTPARSGLVATDLSKAEVTVNASFTLSLVFTDQGRLNNSPVESRAIATAVMTVTNESLIKIEWRNV